jgi:hypothetical protein
MISGSADDGIHATRDHSNVRSILLNTKILRRPIQNKSSYMTIHVCIQLFALEYCWSISTGCCLTTLKVVITLQATATCTYMKDWLRSQRFSNNEELMESVNTWLSSQTADFFDTGIRKLIPRYDKCLIFGGDCVSLNMYVFFVYIFFLVVLLRAHLTLPCE